jgi:hypothetical protein
MIRNTPAPRIGYFEAIPAYEQNLLDAIMKPTRFDVFEYIVYVTPSFKAKIECIPLCVPGSIFTHKAINSEKIV